MKKGLIVILLLVFIGLNILVLISFERQRGVTGFFLSRLFQAAPTVLQGFGEVVLSVLGRFTITIHSPQPLTYFNHTLDLNVSADTEILNWWFTLRRLSGNGVCNGQLVYDGVGFVPNISFTAVRGFNELVVYANSTKGEVENASVVFNISISPHAPFLLLSDSFVVCEGNAFSTLFQAADDDLDCFSDGSVSVNETPPFFIFIHNRFLNTTTIELFSGTLGKSEVGLHRPEITANDGDNLAQKVINISVFPINNIPVIVSIPITTLETYNLTNTSFYYQVPANDIEDGGSNSGNLTFNATFLLGNPFFSINQSTGVINFSYNLSDIGAYQVRICAEDQGIIAPPESFTFCNETGSNKAACFDWDFAVTYVNRRPNITDYGNTKNGRNLSLEINIGELVIFNISAFDPDGNTPYIGWYFDSTFLKRNLLNYDELIFVPSLAEVGAHKLYGIATDLLLNDTIVWNLTIIGPPAPPGAGGGSSGPGGASGAGAGCFEKWGCDEWSTCQNASLNREHENIMKTCSLFNLSEEYCGFQLRRCLDVEGCNATVRKPRELQICYFTLYPSCNDGILNCHDSRCELLVDCGGPCSRCPTCSDEKKNQGEEGIDCGGPCPTCLDIPFFDIRKRVGIAVNLFIFLALLLLLFIAYEVMRIRRLRRQYGKKIKKIVRTESSLSSAQ